MTEPEAMLWSRLRGRAAGAPIFRRQHPLGPYILDFYCPAAKLAVEIDGFVHATAGQPEHDARRDAWLRAEGLTVHRIDAAEVFADLTAVADSVWRLAADLSNRR
jgi:very-short-patch-repair endonuclease